ncbi:interleukin-17 receptor C isoform X3 [Physeter macrocephalus]|uniref:Interleukin-17 receptor C n=1 Tax=Physeter macrocephalus TaxID=9755 RepID=A0A2Y9F439_PHYMC|nr:interleukin-17 receptor C isoform X3 [Physeter catodon]|eukprot:XP_007113799.1 interleukin-17 receptor C isoform X1 [Physeter catodon]
MGVRTPGRGRSQAAQRRDPETGEGFRPLLPAGTQLSGRRGVVSAPLRGGGRTGPQAWVLPGTWKMPVPWFFLSLALGRNPVVLSLERVVGPQDTARCSPGLSCHLWDGDMLCLPGSLVSAAGPVLVPTRLQTELVLRCYKETDCDLCVRVAVHLAVHGYWEEPEDEEKFGIAEDPAIEEPRNASLQAHVVLSFQAYPTARCVLLEVQVPAALVQPGQSVGSVVFDCFEAALGAEVRIWSYTQPRYQKELNLTQQLPDCRGLEVRDSIQSCWALPGLKVSADGDDVRLVLDVPEEQRFGLSLYWNQVPGPAKPWWHRNLTGPQTITLNHTDLVPCLCIQVWHLEPDSVRTSICPFREDPRAHRNLWRAARLQLLPPRAWRLDAPCSLPAEATLCWQAPDGGPCQPLVPPLPLENVTVNKALEFPLLKGHPNICVQVSTWEKQELQECLWADSLGPLKDDMLLVETRGPQDNRSLCALEPSGCTPLLSRASTRAARLGGPLLQDVQSGQCLQLWDDDLGALWACPMEKYIHRRWALIWLACLLLAAMLFLLLLLKKNHVKGWLRLLKEDVRAGAAARSRAALLLYSADDAGFERLVGALASALFQLPLRVAVDLWSRRELSAQGPLAWFHAQRRQTLQEGGVVILLFSPGAVALCREWLQDATSAPGAHGPHDAFAASLSCLLPDFLQGRAPGRYVGAYFDRLLSPDAVPALFRSVPVFSLPSQLPDFLGTLQGPAAPHPWRLAEKAEQVSRALQPALDSCFRAPGTGCGMGPEAEDRT